jgi:GxxExxY protein
MRRDERDPLSGSVIEAAIRVHRILGPGLLESVYETCLAHELSRASVPFDRGRKLPLVYDGVELDQFFRLDLVIAGRLIVELKSVQELHPIHTAQVLTYLRLSGMSHALLMNFNVTRLIDGVRRIRL